MDKKRKSRSTFDCMVFTGGPSDEFVAHAEKYTKEEVLKLIKEEYSYNIEIGEYREPNLEDIKEEFVRWYVRVPDWCGFEGGNTEGCYSFCSENERGSFKVYVVEINDLRIL